MSAAKKDLLIERGADFTYVFILKTGGVPVDLTGCKARAQVREDYDSSTAFLTFTTDNSSIVFEPQIGKVTMSASNVVTSALIQEFGVWDFEFVFSNGKVRRLLMGKVKVSPESTKISNA